MSVFGATPLVLLLLSLKAAFCSPQGERISSEFDVDDIYEAEVFTPGNNPHEENKYDFENGHSSENFNEFSELGELPDYSGMGLWWPNGDGSMASRPAALLNANPMAHLSRIALVATVLGHVVQGGILDYLSVRTGRQTSAVSELGAGVPWVPSDNETRCYEELGCMTLGKGWYHLIYRPFNVFPLEREMINTRFILHTRKNPTDGQVLSAQNDKTIRKSDFDVKKPTKIIIHGFIDTPLSNWVKELRRELLKKDDWNVITVDWAGGSLPLYTQATANTRLVGLELAHFLNHLVSHFGLDPGHVHMIGHSLGAHTAGYAGERVPGIARITGLDPAEPYFQGMPYYVRLDPTDAKFVDVIHTDGKSIFLLGYGMSQPCGHVDFYPNNGKEQPGCDIAENPIPLTLIKEGLEEASRVLLACNHVRAIKLFSDSINSKCQYMAHQCDSYDHYMQGRCFSCKYNSSECMVMGMQAEDYALTLPKSNGMKLFTTTGKEYPFCRKHYRVTIELARPPRAEDWVQGYMRISLHSDDASARNINLTPSGYVKLQHGHSRTFVVSHPAELGSVKKIDFYWEYDMDVLQPRSLCLFWCNDHLYVSRIQVMEMDAPPDTRDKRDNFEDSNVVELCSIGSRSYTDIASRTAATFYNNC